MVATGFAHTILTPKVNSFSFAFRNIVLNNYGLSQLSLQTDLQSYGIQCQNGIIKPVGANTSYHIGTYNSGESFSFSGSYYQDPNSSSNILTLHLGNIDMVVTGVTRSPLSYVVVSPPTNSGRCEFDLEIKSPEINYTLVFPDTFPVGGIVTGVITADVGVPVYGDKRLFFNSFEDLLTGGQFFATLTPNTGFNIVLGDNDTSSQNNNFSWQLALGSIDLPTPFTMKMSRQSLYDGSLTQFNDVNVNTSIATLFNGVWTGDRRFIYSDTPQSITLNYSLFNTDSLGQVASDTITYAFTGVAPLNGQNFISEYVTGFSLTNSGEYITPPKAIFTGYYYVTGLQQGLISMLFSSGCSGNLPVTFSKNSLFGTGASGTLNTHSVLFQNIYGTGTNQFYVVDSFTLISGGTGYGVPPRAIVNTGLYGSGCYDVVARSGVNLAWFLPFATSGGINPAASYLTGEVLVTTGLVSGGAVSGYLVTGFRLTNPGSGYNSSFRPLMRFLRDVSDPLTGHAASGILTTKSTGIYNFNSIWTIETGFAGRTLQSGAYSGTIFVPSDQHYISFRITSSGLDNTVPIVTSLSLTTSAGSGIVDYITGYKTYNIDTGYLKKKFSLTGLFTAGSALSFVLSQSDLDTFYSAAGYTNNDFGIDLGDLDF